MNAALTPAGRLVAHADFHGSRESAFAARGDRRVQAPPSDRGPGPSPGGFMEAMTRSWAAV